MTRLDLEGKNFVTIKIGDEVDDAPHVYVADLINMIAEKLVDDTYSTVFALTGILDNAEGSHNADRAWAKLDKAMQEFAKAYADEALEQGFYAGTIVDLINQAAIDSGYNPKKKKQPRGQLTPLGDLVHDAGIHACEGCFLCAD